MRRKTIFLSFRIPSSPRGYSKQREEGVVQSKQTNWKYSQFRLSSWVALLTLSPSVFFVPGLLLLSGGCSSLFIYGLFSVKKHRVFDHWQTTKGSAEPAGPLAGTLGCWAPGRSCCSPLSEKLIKASAEEKLRTARALSPQWLQWVLAGCRLATGAIATRPSHYLLGISMSFLHSLNI